GWRGGGGRGECVRGMGAAVGGGRRTRPGPRGGNCAADGRAPARTGPTGRLRRRGPAHICGGSVRERPGRGLLGTSPLTGGGERTTVQHRRQLESTDFYAPHRRLAS